MNILDNFDHRLKDRACNSKAELFACLRESWEALPVCILTKLTESVPYKIEKVIAAGGGPTKY